MALLDGDILGGLTDSPLGALLGLLAGGDTGSLGALGGGSSEPSA